MIYKMTHMFVLIFILSSFLRSKQTVHSAEVRLYTLSDCQLRLFIITNTRVASGENGPFCLPFKVFFEMCMPAYPVVLYI